MGGRVGAARSMNEFCAQFGWGRAMGYSATTRQEGRVSVRLSRRQSFPTKSEERPAARLICGLDFSRQESAAIEPDASDSAFESALQSRIGVRADHQRLRIQKAASDFGRVKGHDYFSVHV